MTYTIDTESNAYFNGRDAVLYKDGERVATLALQRSGPSVKVKHGYNLGTKASKREREELPEDRLDSITEGIISDFWQDLAPEIARQHGYQDVWQEGRSGGWCIPHPNKPDFRGAEGWWDHISIDPTEEETALVDDEEPSADVQARERYFDFAVEITKLVESLRTGYFDDRVLEEHEEWSEEVRLERKENEAKERRRNAIEGLSDTRARSLAGQIALGLSREHLNNFISTHGPAEIEAEP